MIPLKVTLTGAPDVMLALDALGSRMRESLGRALYNEANELKNASLQEVPRDTGVLAGSAYMTIDVSGKVMRAEVGYGGAASAYALATHENPRSGKTGGLSPSGRQYKHWAKVGKWKYLEQPFLARVPGLSNRVAAFLRAELHL